MKNLRSKFLFLAIVLVAMLSLTSCSSAEKLQNEVAPAKMEKRVPAVPTLELWIDGKLYQGEKIDFQGKTHEMNIRVAAKDATQPYFINEISVFAHSQRLYDGVPAKVMGNSTLLERDTKTGINLPLTQEDILKLRDGDKIYVEIKDVFHLVDGMKVAMERSPYDKTFVINAL
jgi:hypothetical protein